MYKQSNEDVLNLTPLEYFFLSGTSIVLFSANVTISFFKSLSSSVVLVVLIEKLRPVVLHSLLMVPLLSEGAATVNAFLKSFLPSRLMFE